MFNRVIHVSPPAVNIDVKQQPNDAADAARLYGELRQKAQDEVRLWTIKRLGADNTVTVVKVERETNFEKDNQRVRVLFSINGHAFDIETEHNESALAQSVLAAITDELAKQILSHLYAHLNPAYLRP